MAVKFPLKMADGAMVRTLEDLREHFDLHTVLAYYDNGRLTKWLENGFYDEEAAEVAALHTDSADFAKHLCGILGVDYSEDEAAPVDLGTIAKRNERLQRLKQYTADDTILAAVDRVAFSQEDLSALLENGITEIYLYEGKFVIPEGAESNTYICMAGSEIEYSNEIMGLKKAAEHGDLNAQMKLGDGYYQGVFNLFTQDPAAEAVKWYQMAAEQECAEGQVKLGRCYECGKGVPQDVDTAIEWYEEASQQGYVYADMRLGEYWLNCAYESGSRKAHEPLFNEAVEWFTRAVDKGSISAKMYLGECYMSRAAWYESPQYIAPLRQKALRWFEEAAEQGDVEAQFWLGMRFYYGEGVEEDCELAFEWFKEAAEQGHANAQLRLAHCFLYGHGVEQDRKEAVRWFKSARELGQKAAQHGLDNMKRFDYLHLKVVEQGQGDVETQTELGRCYAEYIGVGQDYSQAVKWYQIAAGQNYAEAQYRLGLYYYNKGQRYYNHWDGEPDYKEAVTWFKKAAKQGHAGAQYQLGLCYDRGYGCRLDQETTVQWLRKAAEQGNAGAQCELGWHYYLGHGVSENKQKAAEWYKKAVDQGHAEAQFRLGLFYDNERNPEAAAEWYRKAAEQGHADAQWKLGQWYRFERDVQVSDLDCADAQYCRGFYNLDDGTETSAESVTFFKKAAEQGHAAALYELGLCYYRGRGIKKSNRKAGEWFKKAAEKGYAAAQEYSYLWNE